jgi:5S rRNA maturation endonuclease (ribonuclease M5)
LSIKVDDDAKRWCCHRYECEHRQGGNLVGLVDLVKPGEHMNGRPRGDRFKAILADLQQIACGTPLSPQAAATSTVAKPPAAAAAVKANVPLAESENERARAVVNLHEKLIADPAAMHPAAANYFRRRPYLTADLCAEWKVGYLPHDSGGDRSGGTMRGKIVYPIHDEQGRLLTYFGRDPQFEEKHTAWKSSDRSEREPEKVHFVKGYHRGLQFFGEHRLAEPEVREAIQRLRHLIVVEGPNNTLRLAALNVPALAVCSNRITREQAERVGRWCRELGVTAAVLFDGDTEGEAGAQQAVGELAHHCPVRLGWSRGMFSGRFKDRQPESLTDEEWEELRGNLLA